MSDLKGTTIRARERTTRSDALGWGGDGGETRRGCGTYTKIAMRMDRISALCGAASRVRTRATPATEATRPKAEIQKGARRPTKGASSKYLTPIVTEAMMTPT
jgi:hypothetical protein